MSYFSTFEKKKCGEKNSKIKVKKRKKKKKRSGERNSILMKWMCEEYCMHVIRTYFRFKMHNPMYRVFLIFYGETSLNTPEPLPVLKYPPKLKKILNFVSWSFNYS